MTHLFFHNDVDGVMSMALFAHKTGLFKPMEYALHGMNTSSRGDKFRSMVDEIQKEPIIIMDYQYHEKATLWIDHHQNDKMGPDPILNDSICYDNRAQSAAALVFKYLESVGHKMEPELTSVLNAVNMVDSANYPAIEFIFKDKSPIMVLRAFFETSFPSEMMFCRCVEVIASCGCDIEKANKVLNIDGSYVDMIEQEAQKVKNRIEIYGNFSLVRQKYAYQYPRYSEFYVANCMYNMRLSNENSTEMRLNISYNKWSGKKSNLNIGTYCSTSKFIKRGGGHYNVGGGIIDKTRLDEFLDAFSVLVEDK
jgi:oligoribonuclease NrnB/cAMP/cGMP phosphodiesterase (DHH superfamily)